MPRVTRGLSLASDPLRIRPEELRRLGRHPSINDAICEEIVREVRKKEIPSTDIQNGQLLENLAKSHIENFKKVAPSRPTASGRVITWGSLCSGSEGVHFVLHAMQQAYRAAGIDVTFKHKFSCESDPKNQQWITNLVQSQIGSEANAPCLFDSIEKMGGKEANCVRHCGACVVCGVDVLVLGTSCKDLSRANSKRSKHSEHILVKSATVGGSAQTFKGFLSYLESHAPSIVLLENVDGMDDNRDAPAGSDMDIALADIAARGYEVQAFLMDNTEFGLPCLRRRYYLVCLRSVGSKCLTPSSRGFDVIFTTMKNFVHVCRRKAPCASTVLLPGNHTSVQAYLATLQQKASERQERGGGRGGAGAWSEQHIRELNQVGGRVGQGCSEASSPWFKVMVRRQQSCLEHAFQVQRSFFMADVSQSLARIRFSLYPEVPETGGIVAPTMMPEQIIWISDRVYGSRLLLGREALMFQGFPVQKVIDLANDTSEHHLQSLAGNSFGFTVVLALLMSTFAAVDWRSPSGPEVASELQSSLPSSSEVVGIALQAFSSLTSQIDSPGKRSGDGSIMDSQPEPRRFRRESPL